MRQLCIVLFISFLFVGTAAAQVSSLTLFAYEPGDDSFTLDDRLGQISTNKAEYVINAEDCVAYTQSGRGLKVTFDVSPAPTGGTWSIEVGNDCSNEPSADDGCTLVEDGSRSLQTTVTRYSFTIPFTQLIDVDCDSGSDKQREMLIIASDSSFTGEETTKPKIELRVRLDFAPPSTPAGLEVSGGNNNLNVSWDSVDGAASYKVYWSETQFDFDSRADANSTSVTTTSVQATSGIENGKSYFVTVTAVDDNGNESVLANFVTGIPQQTRSFYEHYVVTAGEDADDGGFCFVATATYGNYSDPRVVHLRRFRDRVLNGSAFGRSFIDWYYRNGPAWAALIRNHSSARFVAGILLWPVVGLSRIWVAAGPFGAAAVLLLPFGLLLFLIRRRRQRTTLIANSEA